MSIKTSAVSWKRQNLKIKKRKQGVLYKTIHLSYLPECKTTPFTVFREMPVLQNLYNFVHDYKVCVPPPSFSDDELAKNSCHILENAICHLVPPQIENWLEWNSLSIGADHDENRGGKYGMS